MSKAALHRLAAGLFLLCCLLAAAFLWNQRSNLASKIDSDLFALLPHDERDPLAETALARLSQRGERQLVILVGHRDQDAAIRAAQDYSQRLASLPLRTPAALSGDLTALREFYRPYRPGLLTSADQRQLASQTPQAAFEQALGLAFSPFSSAGLAWQDDPFGHYSHWLQALASSSRVRPQQGMLMVENRGMHYVVLLREIAGSAFSFKLQESIAPALDTMGAAVRAAHPGSEILRAGVILHAAAATHTAQQEVSIIGIGGLLGILLLVLLTWRGWQAPVLVTLAVATGLLIATTAVLIYSSKIHVLTLVFGASLVGVAVDYALHALVHTIEDSTPVLTRYRHLLPGMALALLTTVMAYMGLALTPFPGLAQMALFAACGSTAAWLAVMLWFPLLAPHRMAAACLARAYLSRSFRWRPHRRMLVVMSALLLLLALLGFTRFKIHDDIRALVSLKPDLQTEQIAVSQILALPSPAQMFIVTGADIETVLQREEALTAALAPLVEKGQLGGYDALSRWLPSQARQQANKNQVSNLIPVRRQLATELGLPDSWITPSSAPLLDFDHWQASPIADAANHLWLGRSKNAESGSMVLLKGLNDPALVPQLAALSLPGVRWIDKPAEISRLFGRYRILLSWLLLAAYVVTALLLYPRYRTKFWRILLPSAGASLLTTGLLALAGQPLQLLSLIGHLLILGIGVDYGIFLQENAQDRRARLGITLAACTTILSFGLLALSSTPALRNFGLTILFGASTAWALARIGNVEQKA